MASEPLRDRATALAARLRAALRALVDWPERETFGDPPRRSMPAFGVILVMVIALVVGGALNARGLRKTAQIQPDGWARNVGLALTKPLVTLADATGLDEPKEALRTALGRGGEDDIDVAPVLAGTAPGDAAQPPDRTVPPPPPAFSPEKPLRVWIAGDSLVVIPGFALQRAMARAPAIVAVGGLEGRVATGLERPDVYNWFRRVPERMAKLRPTAVVLSFGANDDHGYLTGLPDGVSIDRFGGQRWTREYRRRVGGVMDQVVRRGGYVFWLGLPITSDPARNERHRVLNRIYSSEAARRGGRAHYVDVYRLLQDGNGGYAEYLPDARGRLERVRSGDGIHTEPAGGERIARALLRQFNEVFDLTSWRKRRPPAAGDAPPPTGTRPSP